MAKKYYAVRAGRIPGIYEKWADCQKQVTGYSGAIFKSFPSLEEARRFIAGTADTQPRDIQAIVPDQSPNPAAAIAYVDGSYDPKTKAYACGVVLFYNGQEHRLSKKYTDPEMAEMRNVAGEIMGATEAISFCLAKRIPALQIYHDYEGVARWADGSWRANKAGTKAYSEACRAAGQQLSLRFHKVKGHSGDKYNDLADLLAKTALGL